MVVSRLIVRRLRVARASIEHKRRDLALVFLIRILRVRADMIRGALADGILAILHPLSVEDLVIWNKGMLVAELKK